MNQSSSELYILSTFWDSIFLIQHMNPITHLLSSAKFTLWKYCQPKFIIWLGIYQLYLYPIQKLSGCPCSLWGIVGKIHRVLHQRWQMGLKQALAPSSETLFLCSSCPVCCAQENHPECGRWRYKLPFPPWLWVQIFGETVSSEPASVK